MFEINFLQKMIFFLTYFVNIYLDVKFYTIETYLNILTKPMIFKQKKKNVKKKTITNKTVKQRLY